MHNLIPSGFSGLCVDYVVEFQGRNAPEDHRDSRADWAYDDKKWRNEVSVDANNRGKDPAEEMIDRAKDYTHETKEKTKSAAEKA